MTSDQAKEIRQRLGAARELVRDHTAAYHTNDHASIALIDSSLSNAIRELENLTKHLENRERLAGTKKD